MPRPIVRTTSLTPQRPSLRVALHPLPDHVAADVPVVGKYSFFHRADSYRVHDLPRLPSQSMRRITLIRKCAAHCALQRNLRLSFSLPGERGR